jgi:hypothetical protein
VSTASGMIIKLASMAYKTKCKECSMCCLKITRDVELEERENKFEIIHNQTSSKNKINEVNEQNEEKESNV